MEDRGLPQIADELPELSALPNQDIPEAVREGDKATMTYASSQRRSFPSGQSFAKSGSLLWGVGGLGLAGLIAIPLLFVFRVQPLASSKAENNPPETVTTPSPAASPITNSEPDKLLGHLHYEEAPNSELEPVLPDGKIMLRKAAAEKFEEMVDAAAAEGVILVPLSGFRSVKEQESIFFDVKAERGEVATKRASVSAPPGYSEHHTGYAVDIGDGNAPSTDLQFDFEATKAFKWLKENAPYYSFEMSFPKDNSIGVSYEPWHWRFVGDRQSLETFYQAKQNAETSAAETPAEQPQDEDSESGAVQ